MLEALLFTYKDMFDEDFPLIKFAGQTEIDVINIVYACLQQNKPYEEGMQVENRVFGAPGQKK